jgi:DNA-binding HxlR family transcriptional regulator
VANDRDGQRYYGKGTPTREALERLANRWTILITYALEAGPTRFNDLREQIGVSAQVLTRALRGLERDGLVERRIFAQVPVRVEYSLTALGGSMCEVVHDIRVWAEHNAAAIQQARAAYIPVGTPDEPDRDETND